MLSQCLPIFLIKSYHYAKSQCFNSITLLIFLHHSVYTKVLHAHSNLFSAHNHIEPKDDFYELPPEIVAKIGVYLDASDIYCARKVWRPFKAIELELVPGADGVNIRRVSSRKLKFPLIYFTGATTCQEEIV